jgi:hypothetical protein
MVDTLGTTTYSYTTGGQLLTEDGPFTSDTATNTYVNRQRTRLVLGQPTGVWTNAFAYDLPREIAMHRAASPIIANSRLSASVEAVISRGEAGRLTNVTSLSLFQQGNPCQQRDVLLPLSVL